LASARCGTPRHINYLSELSPGLEAFTPAHDKVSSHGESRIIRQAYFEDPAYVPLVLRAYKLWHQLQEESNENLMRITGGVAIGPREGTLVAGCLRSATTHGLGHDLLDSNQMRRRFPQFALADYEVGFYEEKAGYLKPEECIRQHLRCASKRGADLRFEEPMLCGSASQDGDSVSVTTKSRPTMPNRWCFLSVPGSRNWYQTSRCRSSSRAGFSSEAKNTLRESSSDSGVFPIFLWEPEGSPLFYGTSANRRWEPKDRDSFWR
jgi:sarcosine oxidase